jgi:hypothetical protein
MIVIKPGIRELDAGKTNKVDQIFNTWQKKFAIDNLFKTAITDL